MSGSCGQPSLSSPDVPAVTAGRGASRRPAADREPSAADPRIRSALLALAAQFCDLATFALAVNAVGLAGEANPWMGTLASAGGLERVLLVKVLGAAAAAIIAYRLTPSRWALLPAAVGIVGACSNLWAMA